MFPRQTSWSQYPADTGTVHVNRVKQRFFHLCNFVLYGFLNFLQLVNKRTCRTLKELWTVKLKGMSDSLWYPLDLYLSNHEDVILQHKILIIF